MKVLVVCEKSGVVRDEFIKRGHDATSLDILPSEASGPHIQTDFRDFVHYLLRKEREYDLLIMHPPCTYLSGSGYHWVYRQPGRMEKVNKALEFVHLCFMAPAKHKAIENPIGIISTQIRKPDQIIQPYDFNEDASKKTCLWLDNLPKLKSVKRFHGRIVEYPPDSGRFKERWSNQTDSGQNKLGPSVDREAQRSRTYLGIAKAMAEQWG